MNASLEAIRRQVEELPVSDQLKLVELIVHTVQESTVLKHPIDIVALYGSGKGIWDEDAQEYINRGREDREE